MTKNAFVCQMCGSCCTGEGGIVVSRSDRERLSRLLDIPLAVFEQRYTRRKSQTFYLTTREDGSCVFFSPESGCRVHSGKPDICLAWPFFYGNLRDEVSWKMAQDYCPGIDPEMSHEEFVRQGLDYLQAHGLFQRSGDDGASSLQVENILDSGTKEENCPRNTRNDTKE